MESFHKALDSSPDHLSNCLLQFIVEENTTTLSHLDLLQGDVEDIVAGGMRDDAVCPDTSLKFKATYAGEGIKGSRASPSCDPASDTHRIVILPYYLDR